MIKPYLVQTLWLLLFVSSCSERKGNENPMSEKHTNALIHESSPYLLQHAHNPVDWHPWNEATLQKARKENKLLLISIGYSACHWCHVMERETFENDSAAEFMNKHFINIKVDREERPDVDQVYMNAVQLMTGQGGWPLNCFALPDGRPVYGGTYFKTEAWMQVLAQLTELKENQPDRLMEYATKLTEGIRQSELIVRSERTDLVPLDSLNKLVDDWSKYWDLKEGGPNRAPKFPLPNNFSFLMHYAQASDRADIHAYVKTSLDKMAMGGIYDQVGGGFARYSVDALWKVPHFEKMLYDNAQLIDLYIEAYKAYGTEAYREVALQSLDFIEREMTSEEGLFYSALDADTEGEEGKFYVWKEDELKTLLGELYPLAADYYNISAKGLWEHGNYIPLRTMHPAGYAEKNQLDGEELKKNLQEIQARLLAARMQRTRPGLDDKQLASWNAMMIEAYANAYRSFGEERHLQSAKRGMDKLLDVFRTEEGGLFHSYKNGEARINGYLEDYAFVIQALIVLYEATFDENYLIVAQELAEYTIAHFQDAESGMFWFTSNLDDPLIARKQEVQDNVIPASNSVMAHALFRLGQLFDRSDFTEHAKQMVNNVADNWSYGQSYSNWARALLCMHGPFHLAAISGEEADGALRKGLDQHYLPATLLLGGNQSNLPLMKGKERNEPTLFVCIEGACKMPVNTVNDALDQLRPH